VCEEYYINPTTDGILNWRSIISCASNSNKGLEKWQKQLHELSTSRCARMTHALRWVGIEVREPPTFYGLNDLQEFLIKFEVEVMENKRLPQLDLSKRYTCNVVGYTQGKYQQLVSVKKVTTHQIQVEQEHRYEKKYEGIGKTQENVDKFIV
jgi:hypothetical protein